MKIDFKSFIICIIAISATLPADAQRPAGRYRNLDEMIESLAENPEGGEEFTSWLDELQDLHENPVNINSATKDDLLKIPFLNDITASQMIEYRKKSGPFLSVFEVASVPGIGSDLAEKISFFIMTGEEDGSVVKSSSGKKWSSHELLARGWETFPVSSGFRQDGGKPPAYLGGPEKFYTRCTFENSAGWHAGIIAEKDPGEPFFKDANKYGFDYYSAHLALTTKHKISQVIIGDFTARSGQGLILWQGFSPGRSADVLQASKNISQIRPYSSTDENYFFRGIATAVEFKKSRLNLFVSSKKSDANISLTEDSAIIITSLETSGYHRTHSEMEDKKSIHHTVAGIIYNMAGHNFKTGVTSLYEKLQYPIQPGDQLYEKFNFRGKENFNLGVDYRWVKGRYQLYGEGAVSKSSGMAFIQGLEAHLHDQLNLSVMFRHFDKNYHATWANAFANETKAINETGIYSGIRILPASNVTLSGFIDWFSSPWIKYTTASPSSGYDYLLQADLRFSSHLTAYIRLKDRNREIKTTANNLYINSSEQHQYLRVHVKVDINGKISLQSRIEVNQMAVPVKENGIFVYQDIAWNPGIVPLSAVLRFAWFDTGSYNSRIYVYENDLLYSYSTLSFYGKGIRTYLNLHFHVTKNTEGWLKIANTHCFGQKTMGSGYDEINGNSKSELKIQFRYRF